MAKTFKQWLSAFALLAVAGAAMAAGADLGQAEKQETNWTDRKSVV
jgi:cation/acetate symporter